jgi:hypothetical protein
MIPYTWGTFKNGMLGEYDDKDDNQKAESIMEESKQQDNQDKSGQSILKNTDYYCIICNNKIKDARKMQFCGHQFCNICIK